MKRSSASSHLPDLAFPKDDDQVQVAVSLDVRERRHAAVAADADAAERVRLVRPLLEPRHRRVARVLEEGEPVVEVACAEIKFRGASKTGWLIPTLELAHDQIYSAVVVDVGERRLRVRVPDDGNSREQIIVFSNVGVARSAPRVFQKRSTLPS